jgi:arylformamidase
VRSVRSSVAWLHKNASTYGIDPGRMFAGGSSAGGHLTGMLLAPGWQGDYGLPEDAIRGGVGLSGLYDIRPLCGTHINEWMRLYPDQAERLSPMFQLPNLSLPLVLAVGGLETDGFKNQTNAYESAWRAKGYPVTRVHASERNHFNLLCDMAVPNSPLNEATLSMIFADAK